ncbi:MAG: tRNA (N(6)-L-threonylcarbamoyladenosine(37)-C(2))-methylthiotransferase MtaB [Lachnospiraceae bacterium]|nr:tRNA (N(6)-L-threonylcarbamoyladenosine(37)-C(2))-methylthiotransferase MtaB [Lachnospiraceae bacterium]
MNEYRFDNKKVAFCTLGCKVNSYESDAMEELFKSAGCEIVDFEDKADIYVINTCSVTNMADRKSRQMLHKAKKNNPESIVVATGCYVQTAKDEVLEDMSVDLVIGNNQKSGIIELIAQYINNIELNSKVSDISKKCEYENMMISSTAEKTRAYIKIQDGCNQFCTYCIIPYARGRIRSRAHDDIIKEIKNLEEKGYKEVVLTGIHISSYGLDFAEDEESTLTIAKKFRPEYLLKLVKDIASIDGIKRIRLGSLEPRVIEEEFIRELASVDKVCPQFHLSLQSGCDETLKRMNRKYSAKEYEEKCCIIRKFYDNPAITTDVIVGFPGETDEEFSKTLEFLKRINLAKIHVFKYSMRKGTVAARMANQVPDNIKTLRSKMLIELTTKQHEAYMESLLDKKQLILLEENVEINGVKYNIGYNEQYVRFAIKDINELSNELVLVKPIKILNEEFIEAIKTM